MFPIIFSLKWNFDFGEILVLISSFRSRAPKLSIQQSWFKKCVNRDIAHPSFYSLSYSQKTFNPFRTGGLKSAKHRSLGTTYMFKAIVNHLKLGSKGWKFLGWFHLQSSLIDVILGHQPLSRSIWEQFYFYTYIHVFRLLGPQQVSFGRISTYLGQVFRPSEYTLLA